MSFKEPISLYFNFKQLEIMTKLIELFTNEIFRMHQKMGDTHSYSSIMSAIKQCCHSHLLLCQETMKLKKRKSPLQKILLRDPNLICEAHKLISDGDEVDRLIEKTIKAFKMSWRSMMQMDKNDSYLLICSAKVKKRFVNLLFNDAPRTINLLIQIMNSCLLMEFEGT